MSYCKSNSCYNSTNYSWNDYCSYHERCLSKLREYNSSISNIKEVETFETWFNKNCGYVINYDSSSSYPYYIWIVVFEPSVRSMSESFSTIKYKCGYSGLSGASDKARRIKNKLQNGGWYDIPMLKIHPKAKSWEHFSDLITSPYVMKRYVPQKWEVRYGPFLAPGQMDVQVPVDNISDYAKVFDILKVCCGSYEHVGVYVGNGEVCHFSKGRNGTYIDSWGDFKKFDGFEGNIDSSEATVYHPAIPFKYSQRIAEQIAWAVSNNFRRNDYDLRNRNCEHFANMCVYGINYSEQIEKNKLVKFTSEVVVGIKAGLLAPFTIPFGREISISGPSVNNNKGSTIRLINEMSESNGKLGERNNSLSDQIKARVEVPAKNNCRIM